MSNFGMRPSIEFMKDYFKNKEVVGVELGVWKGENAERLLSMLNVKMLHLIDLWITPDGAKDRYDYNEHYKIVVKKFEENKTVSIWVSDTVEASKYYKDNSLEFVYVDADHYYEGCSRDLEVWYPKVKKGGIICGHDYHACEGVKKAVLEFLSTNGLTSEQFKVFDAIGIHDKVKYGEWLVIK